MATKTNNENQLPKISRCPFCGAENLSTCEDFTGCWVVCENCATEGPKGAPTKEAAIEAWNNRAKTPPKHRPSAVCTRGDRINIGDALFRGDIHVEHVLPLHAAPNQMSLYGGWEVLGEALRERDWGQLEELFPNESGEWLADEMRDNEALLCALRQIGGWVLMGTYATVGKISLKENGDFASCSVYCGIERGFTVWGKTYKQAIAKAINEQRRYFEGEVKKAREARHGA
ncbi:Lar family restriction alleviation protein [Desulfovibrio sp.]|uniref:Lar family restriction alleviation protein n=1 Tax=Desulfovibrio sp. TaxID=885 RepID=UPI003AAF08D9